MNLLKSQAVHSRHLQLQGISFTPVKPHALTVRDMAISTAPIFKCGLTLLDPRKVSIHAASVCQYHVMCCAECSAYGSLLPTCYFAPHYRVLLYGWHPPLVAADKPIRSRLPNSPPVSHFLPTVQKLIRTQLDRNVIRARADREYVIVSPLHVVLKNSDRYRASHLVHGQLSNSSQLQATNEALLNLSPPQEAIKVRPVINLTGSGVNSRYYCPPYSNTCVDDVIARMSPNCYQCVFDAESYYNSFALAATFIGVIAFVFLRRVFVATAILFGFAPAPAFCAQFSAEFHSWFTVLGIISVVMTDDFWVCNNTEALVCADRDRMKNILNTCGFHFSPAKDQLGQCVVYLGFLLDSVTMTVSFHRDNARCYVLQLGSIRKGLLLSPPQLCLANARSVAGKLNHYASLVQRGRLHIRSFWQYCHDETHLGLYSARMVRDLDYWLDVLTPWSQGSLLHNQFPIINSSHLLHDPTKLTVMRSDASGQVDEYDAMLNGGYGYLWGPLDDPNPQFFADYWGDEIFFGPHSHAAELSVLKAFLSHNRVHHTILIWISDCASAVWSINKGYCNNHSSFLLLSSILRMCDECHIWIVAFWWPREEGALEDYLSHFNSLLLRHSISGRVADLPPQSHSPHAGTSARV